MVIILWLFKLCFKLLCKRTTTTRWTSESNKEIIKPTKSIANVKVTISEEKMWPLMEELSSDEDEGAEEELQEPTQEVNHLNGKGISACLNSNVGITVSTIRVNPSSKLDNLSISLDELHSMIDCRLRVLKVNQMFSRKAQLKRFIERKKMLRSQSQKYSKERGQPQEWQCRK